MLSLAVVYPESTRQLLADLRRLNMKASFFLAPLAAGRSLDDEQCDLLHEMIRDGHGVHSRTVLNRVAVIAHPDLWRLRLNDPSQLPADFVGRDPQ